MTTPRRVAVTLEVIVDERTPASAEVHGAECVMTIETEDIYAWVTELEQPAHVRINEADRW